MAYPYPHRTRTKYMEIFSAVGQVDIHNITPTGGSVDFNLPRGAYAIQVSAWATLNDKPVVLTISPYVDDEQTLTSGANKFLEAGAVTATTNITVETATATVKGYQVVIVPAGDQYGAAAPVMVLAGAKMTIATTATTGILNYSYVAVEL